MLQSAQQLQGFSLGASDGEIGRVDDVYFDDQHWTLRYLVVKTGGWLSGRKVLISPPRSPPLYKGPSAPPSPPALSSSARLVAWEPRSRKVVPIGPAS